MQTLQQVIDQIQHLGEVNGAWANINTEHTAYTGLKIPVDGWDYEENLAETAGLLFETEEPTNEQVALVVKAYEALALDPDLYDSYLLQTVYQVANVDFYEFIDYCNQAGIEPEVIEEFKEIDEEGEEEPEVAKGETEEEKAQRISRLADEILGIL